MAEPGLIDEAVKWGTGGIGVGSGLAIIAVSVRWMVNFVFGRIDQRQNRIDAEDAELDQKWRAYRLTLEDRLTRQDAKIAALEYDVELCHREKRELEDRLSRIEGFARKGNRPA